MERFYGTPVAEGDELIATLPADVRRRSADVLLAAVVGQILEPGVFTLATLPELKSPGLALFTPLPGPVPGPEALQAMLRAAEALAGELGGRLADKERRPLTRKQLDRLAAIAVQFSAAKRAES